MSLPFGITEFVRIRGRYACEYCGVTESNTGGRLSIDHYISQSSRGTDDIANLIYCCFRCNLYKSDFHSSDPFITPIWNPREELFDVHFKILENSLLEGLTDIGKQTINKLKLNRKSLVFYRKKNKRLFNEANEASLTEDLTSLLIRVENKFLRLGSYKIELIKELIELQNHYRRKLKDL